jgi:hypothetical protein
MTVRSDHYQFGQFRLDPEAGILYRGTEPTMLGQRAVAMLRLLLENAGIPVSKDSLVEAGWGGLAVADNNLTVQIAALRRVLAERRVPRAGSRRCRGEATDMSGRPLSPTSPMRRLPPAPRRHRHCPKSPPSPFYRSRT